jgi:hypothetical protein
MAPGTIFIGNTADFAAARRLRLTGHVTEARGAVG